MFIASFKSVCLYMSNPLFNTLMSKITDSMAQNTLTCLIMALTEK